MLKYPFTRLFMAYWLITTRFSRNFKTDSSDFLKKNVYKKIKCIVKYVVALNFYQRGDVLPSMVGRVDINFKLKLN